MEIAGKSAIVVGGASGMARATAETFAAKGGRVAILDRAQSAGADVAKLLGGALRRVRRHRLRRDREGAARRRGVARRRAFLREHRGRRRRDAYAHQGRPALARSVPQGRRPEPGRELQRGAHRRPVHEHEHSRRGGRARGDPDDRIDRGFRGADRPSGLHRRQGRHRRHDVHDGARPRQPRHPRDDDRTEPVLDGPHQGHSRADGGEPVRRTPPSRNAWGGPRSSPRWRSRSSRTRC